MDYLITSYSFRTEGESSKNKYSMNNKKKQKQCVMIECVKLLTKHCYASVLNS